jgi:hypothetical protein
VTMAQGAWCGGTDLIRSFVFGSGDPSEGEVRRIGRNPAPALSVLTTA